jgi:putative ABC transport system ATP-binding protein
MATKNEKGLTLYQPGAVAPAAAVKAQGRWLPPPPEVVLEAQAVRKRYQMGEHSVEALRGVEFRVEKGEFVAIMGPSGSGKSTLLHLLGGLDAPSEGEITLAGLPLSQLNEKQITLARRHNVGFVFQFFNLLPTLSAEENVLLPVIIDGKDAKPYEERLTSLLDLVGLLDRRGHKPDQLSGGEQQRVAIARALITEPAILLADEPTGNLDSKTGNAIMSLLRRSCDQLRQTVIVVTHDPKAAAYADRVVFLRDGVVVKDFRHSRFANFSQRLKSIIKTMEQLEADRD